LNSTEISMFGQTTFNSSVSDKSVEFNDFSLAGSNSPSFELGLWLNGLAAFLNTENHSFVDGNQAKASKRDWTNETRLTKFTLLHAAKLTSRLIFETRKVTSDEDLFNNLESVTNLSGNPQFSAEELSNLAFCLRNFSVLAESLMRSSPISFHEWTAWSNLLEKELSNSQIVLDLIEKTECINAGSLPVKFQELLVNKQLPSNLMADLQTVLPYFNKIFKYLGLIENMLENDKPLKPSLLFFATIYGQSQEMMAYLKNRLLRFTDEQNLMFEALDCAGFAISMEVRKVYQSELGEVSTIRQAPLLCAKIEAAFGLLRDCFQQTFVGFAQLVEPEIEPIKLFANFNIKLEQSIILRKELWETLQVVKNVEKNPEPIQIQELQDQLANFVHGSMKFLMYKDLETVERFIEEVLLTKNSADLVPTLHSSVHFFARFVHRSKLFFNESINLFIHFVQFPTFFRIDRMMRRSCVRFLACLCVSALSQKLTFLIL
jgi:hypothetical protein